MPNLLRVSNVHNNTVWEKHLSDAELPTVQEFTKGASTIAILPATFRPVRTHNLVDFSKDFFLPTVINHAIYVQNIAGKFFAIIFGIALDLVTFPLRVITVIPRVISNTVKEENTLHKYLRTQGADAKLLADDYVKVKLEWNRTSQTPTSALTTRDGTVHRRYGQEKHWFEKTVNFIELPSYPGSDCYESGMNV